MAAQQGRLILLRVDTTGGGVYSTAAGLRAKSIKLNNGMADVTNSDSANAWRELLEGAGIKSMSLTGSGVFKDAAVDETVRGLFVAGTHRNWQVVIPDFGTFTAKFHIADLTYEGNHDGEVTYSITLESANEPAWAAA